MIEIPPNIDEIKTLAKQNDRSFSQYVNLVLRKYLKENKERMKNKDNGRELS